MINISEHIRNRIQHGDYSEIARIYNRRHKRERKSISISYVRMVIIGERQITEDSVSEEIIRIAEKYFELKEVMNDELMELQPT